MGEKEIFEKRKKEVIRYLKQKQEWLFYLCLAILVYLGTFLRRLNMHGLKDITTGTWTLGPDLDPFLFLRWAKYIVAHGSLMQIDVMRYVPIGYNTAGEMKLLSYLIAWFYQLVSFFNSNATLTYVAVIFPVFMFGLAIIAFFLFARKIFEKKSSIFKNSVAIIATALFIVMPSLLPRTIAGIPEKESASYFFIFMALYFIIASYNAKTIKKSWIFAGLSGITTGLLALIWGGFGYVFIGISGAFLFLFILNKIEKREVGIFSLWMIFSFALMTPFSTRYNPLNLIVSVSTGIAFGVLGIFIIDLILRKNNFFGLTKKTKIPKRIISIIVAIILGIILSSIFIEPLFIVDKIKDVISQTVHPLGSNRLSLTIAENKQPSFVGEWKGVFGPIVMNIPLFFWMFFAGAVVLFYSLIKKMRFKEKFFMTLGYLVFLTSLIFSRYSPNGILNGNNGISILVYFGGALFFVATFGYHYYQRFKEGEEEVFKSFDFGIILYFVLLTMAIMGARGGIRLIMVLAAFAPIAVSYLIVITCASFLKTKGENLKTFLGILAIILILSGLFTFSTYYSSVENSARNFILGPYQWQWQNAMAWVRENVSKEAVFAHWWDYGYWVQSIGERATILDGGNSISYWNYLMGRHVLTGRSEEEALDFLYSHNATHILIDSTEIGKYTAYSSIGSDENYDRFSWIMTFIKDEKQTVEKQNETLEVYQGSFALDEDLVWTKEDGTKILLPKKAAGVIAVITKTDSKGAIKQPEAVFAYRGEQYRIPLKYIYINDQLIKFGRGIEAGIFIYPRLDAVSGGKVVIKRKGAAFYLSNRTLNGNMAQWYLFGKESENIKLVHSQKNYIIEMLEKQGQKLGEFIYYGGFQGPIKIWKINYPKGMQTKDIYLQTYYPKEKLSQAKEGEY